MSVKEICYQLTDNKRQRNKDREKENNLTRQKRSNLQKMCEREKFLARFVEVTNNVEVTNVYNIMCMYMGKVSFHKGLQVYFYKSSLSYCDIQNRGKHPQSSS